VKFEYLKIAAVNNGESAATGRDSRCDESAYIRPRVPLKMKELITRVRIENAIDI